MCQIITYFNVIFYVESNGTSVILPIPDTRDLFKIFLTWRQL